MQKDNHGTPHPKHRSRRYRMMRNRIIIVTSSVLVICLLTMGLAALLQNLHPKTAASSGSGSSVSASSAKAETKSSQITILGTGDDLIHSSIYKSCATSSGGYDFRPVYKQIKSNVSAANVAFVNQETVMAPSVGALSGYPCFNSPTQVGDALVDTGFDVISQGNNHMLDMGQKGLLATLDYWKSKKGIQVVGAYRNQADLDNIRIVEKNGIKTAWIGVVEMTNDISLPSDSPMKIVYTSQRDEIKKLITKARSLADVVVVSAHWGEEDQYTLSDTEKKLGQDMVDWGADVILGNHPHVLQQLTTLTRKSDGAVCPVMYAFGNLISTQRKSQNLVSGQLTVTYKKDEKGKVTFSGMKFKPSVTYYEAGGQNVHVVMLKDFSNAMAQKSRTWEITSGEFTPNYAKKVVNKSIPQKYQDWT
ncbi:MULTISPECIES: CapA family protein [Caproicibacterium]|jgi:poly-gamma-glutamate synthesis protein (capsule biosynthesis protein)|nr:CapA family protein [Caproicibacterium lactatifermentans]MDD4807205.1 CapA family protein [Oscillospiraceae bacterium]